MATASRRHVFTNPEAARWKSQGFGNPSDTIRRFHASLPDFEVTKLFSLTNIAKELGVKRVLVKDETSRLGLPSFKILGASWAIHQAIVDEYRLPVTAQVADISQLAKQNSISIVAATDGNHGRAVARISALLGISKVKIFVPKGLDKSTVDHIIGEGATVVVVEGDYDLAVKAAFIDSKGGSLLIQDTAFKGYEKVPQWIVDGYSTLFHEVSEQLDGKAPDLLIVPAGVGSLAQAAVQYSKSSSGPSAVMTVEPDTAACLFKSLMAGKAEPIRTYTTIMAGMNCGTVSTIAWPILKSGVDFSATVSDYEAHLAVQELVEAGVPVGPCGGAALAALRFIHGVSPFSLKLDQDSTVVLIATEGFRDYKEPRDVRSDDPVVLTQTLTRIDSSNPGLSAAAGANEVEIAQFIASWLEHRDIEVNWVEDVPGRPSVVGRVHGTGGGKSLMFNGHIDTVTLVGYEGDPLSGDIVDDSVQGRGSMDMKAGVAAALVALSTAKSKPVRGDVIIAAVADEENLSIGTEQVLAAGWRAHGAVVAEPSWHDLVLSHKGFVWLDIDVIGLSAHGSRPADGVDAIIKAGHFLVELEKYGKEVMAREPTSALGTGSVHAGVIRGGEEPSTYPAKCTITIERRTVPGEDAATVRHELETILESLAAKDKDFKYNIRINFSRPPFSLKPTHPFALAVSKSVAKVLGSQPKVRAESAWTDCALLQQAGIPTVLFGVHGEGLHSKKEHAVVSSIKEVTLALQQIVDDFCG